MARLKSEHLAELRQLHAVAQAVIDGLVAGGHLDGLAPQLRQGLGRALELQDLRGMRMAVRHLGDLVTALPPAERREFVLAVERTAGEHWSGST